MSLVGDHFLYSHDLSVCFRGDTDKRKLLLGFKGLKTTSIKFDFPFNAHSQLVSPYQQPLVKKVTKTPVLT